MRIQRPTLLFLIALCSLFFSQLVSCGNQGASITQTASPTRPAQGFQAAGIDPSQSDRSAPPVILHNPSPGQLEAYISVTMGGYDRTSREMTMIGLSFASNGNLVQFAGQERLICNGKAMPLHNQIAEFQVADALTSTLEGKAFSCTYSAGNASATLTFTIPHAPLIHSPQNLAQVPRRANTIITYYVQGGKLLGIAALGPVGPDAKALAHLDTPGMMQATVDTRAFSTGEGSISLTQILDLQATQTGMPFKSLGTGGTAMTMVAVTWI